MSSKKGITKCLVIALLFLLLLPLGALARLHLQFGIEPTYTLAFANPAKDYYRDLNEDFRTGKYTFTTPIADANGKSLWKDIKMPNSKEFGVEGSCLVKLKSGKIKNPRIGVVIGYRGSSSSNDYDESYDIWDKYYKGGSYVPGNFKRQEDIGTSTISLGARGKAGLTKKLDVSATLGGNFYRVKGDVNYTMDRLDNPYVQWREADYKGNGTGFVIEAGVDYKIIKNMLVGTGFGYRSGKVKTKGEEVKTEISNPGMSWTRNYSPEFNFNSTYGKFYVQISF